MNNIGIVPEIVWDEPQDWNALGDPGLSATSGGGQLGISSKTLRVFPTWLEDRLRPLSFRFARLGLDRYDFIYCFEPGLRMPCGVPNLCVVSGPGYVRMPGDRPDWRPPHRLREVRKAASLLTSPLLRPDRYSRYVTHSDWIADLFLDRFGFRPRVIWPPARSRALPPASPDRSGFLFLSRFEECKRAESMLAIAGAFPEQKVTIAGVVLGSNRTYVARLQECVRQMRLSNVRIIENPSERNVALLLTSHEFFVFPAPWEHFGIVTVEAIGAGLLPLVHDTGGQREIIPLPSLRFSSEQGLVERARNVLRMPVEERLKLVTELRRHVDRGSPEHYREAMLEELRSLQRRQ
jgi:glycosyltransferase involved in cell wall biosynthesis